MEREHASHITLYSSHLFNTLVYRRGGGPSGLPHVLCRQGFLAMKKQGFLPTRDCESSFSLVMRLKVFLPAGVETQGFLATNGDCTGFSSIDSGSPGFLAICVRGPGFPLIYGGGPGCSLHYQWIDAQGFLSTMKAQGFLPIDGGVPGSSVAVGGLGFSSH